MVCIRGLCNMLAFLVRSIPQSIYAPIPSTNFVDSKTNLGLLDLYPPATQLRDSFYVASTNSQGLFYSTCRQPIGRHLFNEGRTAQTDSILYTLSQAKSQGDHVYLS